MTNLPEKLRLKEMAEEDVYFARRDRELIKALHRRKLAEHLEIEAPKDKKKAQKLEERYATATTKHWRSPWKLGDHYRDLIRQVLKLVKRKRD